MASEMKVFFPLQVFFPSQAGGPANSVYWLAKYLKRNGIEPTVISTDQGVNTPVRLNRFIETEAGCVMHVRTRIIYFPFVQMLRSLRGVIGADVVQVSSVFFPAAVVSALAARILHKKLVVSPRDELSQYGLTRSRGRKRPILWMYRNFIARHAVFHATAEKEVADIKGYFTFDVPVVHIPNLIEMPPLIETDDERYLLFIGRLDRKKGVDKLIEAAARSEHFRNGTIKLKVAGKGDTAYEEKLRQLSAKLGIEGRVEFLGQVEGGEKQRLLAGAAWTFMPSESENFGVVVLESLAQNTPVVASKGTPWAVLDAEKIGYWVENSPVELAAILDRLIMLPEDEYAAYRGRCRAFVERNFEINANGRAWLDLYNSLK